MKYEKCLVIINSETREFHHTFSNFDRFILKTLNADLALSVAINEREDQTNPFYTHAKYLWQYPEPENWGDAFDYATEYENTENNWRMVTEIQNQWLGGIKGINEQKGSAGILLFFRWFTKIKLIENNLLEKYDRFIYTRSDYLFKTPHLPLSLLPKNKIWVPFGEEYGGITDRYMLCSSENIINALSILDPVLKSPAQLTQDMSYANDWNLESYIKFFFEKKGLWHLVRKIPFSMYSVRSEEGHTRWNEGVLNNELGYYVKYEKEFLAAQISEKIFETYGNWNRLSLLIFQIRVRVKYFIVDQKKFIRETIRKLGIRKTYRKIVFVFNKIFG
jgi:hypothetical protein